MVKVTAKEKTLAFLSYFLIGILFYYLSDKKTKNSKYLKFHIMQAINLLFFTFIFILTDLLLFIIAVGFGFLVKIGWIISIIALILLVIFSIVLVSLWSNSLVNVFSNDKKETVLIGKYAKTYINF